MIDVSSLKKEIVKSGKDNRSILYIKEGEKRRIRFLDDLQEGVAVKFHDNYKLAIKVPCQEVFGRPCSHCDNEELRTRNLYFWTVYDYENKERKLLSAAVSNCSPVPTMTAIYEEYGTLTDRDYVIKRVGGGTDTSYTMLPQDRQPFRNKKVKPYKESEILQLIDKIYPDEEAEEEEASRKSKGSGVKGKMNLPEDSEDNWEEDEEEKDYESMTAQELYKLCKERGIACKPRKAQRFYIDLLEDDDYMNSEDNWEEDEEEKEDDELPFH